MQSEHIFQQLIEKAIRIAVKRDLTNDVSVGRVGCVLVTKAGKEYTGVNLKAAGDLGFCAEVTAFAQMINDAETEVVMLVGVNNEGEIIPPCGRCRELLYQLNRKNLNTKIIISSTEYISLEKLLPHRWQDYWSNRA